MNYSLWESRSWQLYKRTLKLSELQTGALAEDNFPLPMCKKNSPSSLFLLLMMTDFEGIEYYKNQMF